MHGQPRKRASPGRARPEPSAGSRGFFLGSPKGRPGGGVVRPTSPWRIAYPAGLEPETNLSIMSTRAPVENADTVSLVCALLVRFPELASIRSGPADRTLRLTFAVRQRLDKAAQRALAEAVQEHVTSFLALAKEEPGVLRVDCEGDRAL